MAEREVRVVTEVTEGKAESAALVEGRALEVEMGVVAVLEAAEEAMGALEVGMEDLEGDGEDLEGMGVAWVAWEEVWGSEGGY